MLFLYINTFFFSLCSKLHFHFFFVYTNRVYVYASDWFVCAHYWLIIFFPFLRSFSNLILIFFLIFFLFKSFLFASFLNTFFSMTFIHFLFFWTVFFPFSKLFLKGLKVRIIFPNGTDWYLLQNKSAHKFTPIHTVLKTKT